MKFKNLLYLPLSLLVVTSCGPINSESSSLITSENVTTSQESVPSEEITSSDITTSEEALNWSDDVLTMQKDYLNGHTIPYVTLDGGYWLYNVHDKCLAYRKDNGELSDIENFVNGIVKAGYIDGTSEENGCYNPYQRYVYLPLANSEKNENINMFITRYMKTREVNIDIKYHIDNSNWPAKEISDALLNVHGVNLNLPEPSFEYSDYEIDAVKEFGQCIIYLYGQDHSKDYYDDLINAGFISNPDIFYQYQVKDKDDHINIAVTYDNDYEATMISCFKYS